MTLFGLLQFKFSAWHAVGEASTLCVTVLDANLACTLASTLSASPCMTTFFEPAPVVGTACTGKAEPPAKVAWTSGRPRQRCPAAPLTELPQVFVVKSELISKLQEWS